MPEDQDVEQTPREPENFANLPRVRKPYVKPAFRHERVFETTAAACGKALPTAVCKHHKKQS